MKRCLILFTLIAIVLVFTADAQVYQHKTKILVAPSATSPVVGWVDTLWVGVSGDGAGGTIIDNTYLADVGTEFGAYGLWRELLSPPDPPDPFPNGGFVSKFVDIPFRTGLGLGLKPYDFRGFTSESQVDTYCIRIYGDGTNQIISLGSITLTWESNLSLFSSGTWELKKRASGTTYNTVVADMKSGGTSWTDDNTGGSNDIRYLIIKTGVAPGVGVSETKNLNPARFMLEQNYPNPFNPATVINFSVEKRDLATLRVYNLLGQEVMNLFHGIAEPGKTYSVDFNGKQLSSGIYFYTLTSAGNVDTKKMMMIK